MKIYFFRHGQPDIGESRHQLPDSPLSSHGFDQAKFVAKRFTHIPIDIILTSSYTRALQTAQEIEKVTAAPLSQSEFLVERRMPVSFHGKLRTDPEITQIHQEMREHFYERDWHYADEENFMDLLTRVKSSLHLVLSQEKENIAVVTHGAFLTTLIYVMLFGDKVDPASFKSFREHTANSNTGLTICEYKNEKWTLLTWNDIAHLGE